MRRVCTSPLCGFHAHWRPSSRVHACLSVPLVVLLLPLLLHVQVRSFENTVHRITVTKRPGMENVPLLVDSGKEGTYEAQQQEVGMCAWWC